MIYGIDLSRDCRLSEREGLVESLKQRVGMYRDDKITLEHYKKHYDKIVELDCGKDNSEFTSTYGCIS